MPKRIYLHEGERFHLLSVLRGDIICPDTNQTLSECMCDCGNIVYRRNTALRTGKVKSCGCLIEPTYRKNIGVPSSELIRYTPGDKFGNLTVIGERLKKTEYVYDCKCELCGETLVVKRANLERGQWTHKGCELNQMKAGTEYGFLKLLSIVSIEGKKMAHCKCLCGAETYKRPADLRTGRVKSCGKRCTARFIK